MRAEMPAQPHHRLGQRRRRDDEADAQRWRQRLGDGTDVEHPAGAVERLQWRYRAAAVAELAVVVVLQAPGPAARRIAARCIAARLAQLGRAARLDRVWPFASLAQGGGNKKTITMK